jgi:Cu(I)/Ag(I) efflux system membrane fusion protein
MKIKKIFSNPYFRGALLVLAGLLFGRLIFHRPHEDKTLPEQSISETKKTIWTCAMHPQIRMDHPGKCPICGMDLIPLEQSTAPLDPDAVVMTDEGIKLAEVQTSIVSRERPVKEVRLYGKIKADERLVQTQPAHIPGRIEKLLVNFTGEEVKKGQAIALIYSPELLNAQEELLEAQKMKDMQPGILEAAREKLRQWKFTDDQISEIERSGKTKTVFDVYSTVSGIVINKHVNMGDYVVQGAPLYEIADLSHVWALFDAYETDLPWIRKGDRVSFTLQSLPGKEFYGTISFIDPVIDPYTRVARIRVEVPNPGNSLKPEMFATGTVKARLPGAGNRLVIPQSAVLWTGTRSVVYIKVPEAQEPSFVMREITLGPALSNSYIVLAGLNEGEEIVTNGTFSVDAAAQLTGKPSMMNTAGGETSTMPGMIMPGGQQPDNRQRKEGIVIPGNNAGQNNESTGNQFDAGNTGNQKKETPGMDFKMQLNSIYDKYIVLKNSFVQSDEKGIILETENVRQALARADMEDLGGKMVNNWGELLAGMNKQIDNIKSSDSLEEQREIFSVFNDLFYKAIKSFGLMGKTVYYQFCPMMNDGNGAYWLSETRDIRNPYYGESMLTCGETVETLNY